MVRPWGTFLDLEVGLSCFEHKRKPAFANILSPVIQHLHSCSIVFQISDRYNLCQSLRWDKLQWNYPLRSSNLGLHNTYIQHKWEKNPLFSLDIDNNTNYFSFPSFVACIWAAPNSVALCSQETRTCSAAFPCYCGRPSTSIMAVFYISIISVFQRKSAHCPTKRAFPCQFPHPNQGAKLKFLPYTWIYLFPVLLCLY